MEVDDGELPRASRRAGTSVTTTAAPPRLCAICQSTVLGDVASIALHARSHLHFAIFHCALCQQSTDSFAALGEHAAQFHAASGCGAIVQQARTQLLECLIRMTQMCFPGSSMQCELCATPVDLRWPAVDQHLWLHSGHSPFTCPLCQQSFASMKNIQEHIVTAHPDSYPLFAVTVRWHLHDAHLCALVFPAFDSLVEPAPLMDAHGTNIDCQLCHTDIVRSSDAINTHAKVHLAYRPLHCERCTFQHFSMAKMRAHSHRAHPAETIRISYHPVADIGGQLKLMKLKCFGAYASSNAINGTIDTNNFDDPMDDSSDDDDEVVVSAVIADGQLRKSPPVDRLYQCRYCTYRSCTRTKVAAHIQSEHGGSPIRIDRKPQKSPKLDPSRSTNGTHVGSRFKCNLCHVSVVGTRSSMDEHINSHIGRKYYHCSMCNYRSEQPTRIKHHIASTHPLHKHTKIDCYPEDGPIGLDRIRQCCFDADQWRQATSTTGRSSSIKAIDLMTQKLNGDDDDVDDEKFVEMDMDDAPTPFTGNNTSSSARVQCCMCKALVPSQSATIASHVRHHIDEFKPFGCSGCDASAYTDTEIRQHMLLHKGSAKMTVERMQLASMHDRCFPHIRLSSTGATTLTSSKMMTNVDHLTSSNTGGVGYNNSSGGGLKKLICQLCKNTIADNPKSVGIHVKNHLNYKPYRCSFCKYMSCEQSKARRHVEHVHSVSGDAVEVHPEEGIKERIADMKIRCFPMLNGDLDTVASASTMAANNNDDGGGALSMVVSDRGGTLGATTKCQMCHENVIGGSGVDAHVRSHLGKAFRCEYCTCRYWSEEMVRKHLASAHPAEPACFINQSADLDGQYYVIKSKCFPMLADDTQLMLMMSSIVDNAGSENSNDMGDEQLIGYGSIAATNRPPTAQNRGSLAEGKLACSVCNNWVSVNPNSLDVHSKTHLNFKQHQCGYCQYRSCISGKVKRHLDNVHRGQDVSMLSLTALSTGLKQVITDMRILCFPQIDGEYVPQSQMTMNRKVDALKKALVDELTAMQTNVELDTTERAAASATVAAAACNSPPSTIKAPHETSPLQLSSNQSWNSLCDDDSASVNGQSESTVGKLQCQRCLSYVADNPSSLGLHVRNHLDYKPFSCNLCDYKSCIQAKVKRHLRNVHKCPTDEMTYAPEADIRVKVMDMKMRCFPKIVEAGSSPSSIFMSPELFDLSSMMMFNGNNCESPPIVEKQSSTKAPSNGGSRSSLDKLLGAKFKAGLLNSTGVGEAPDENDDAEEEDEDEEDEWDECQICDQPVSVSQRRVHIEQHANDSRWMCSDCGFDSLIERIVAEHTRDHVGNASLPVRFPFSGSLSDEDERRFGIECFNGESSTMDDDESVDDDDDDNQMDQIQCRQCEQSIGASVQSVHAHLKRHHMDEYRPPYACAHCDRRYESESTLDAHQHDAHQQSGGIVNYLPTARIDRQLADARQKCFPDWEPDSRKVSCRLCTANDRQVSDTSISRMVHAKKHIGLKPYHCGYCAFRGCLKSETRRHIGRAHPKTSPKIVYRREKLVTKMALKEMLRKCFGNQHHLP